MIRRLTFVGIDGRVILDVTVVCVGVLVKRVGNGMEDVIVVRGTVVFVDDVVVRAGTVVLVCSVVEDDDELVVTHRRLLIQRPQAPRRIRARPPPAAGMSPMGGPVFGNSPSPVGTPLGMGVVSGTVLVSEVGGGTGEDAGTVVLVVVVEGSGVGGSVVVVVPGVKVVVGADVVVVVDGGTPSQSRVTDAPALDTRSMCHANVAVGPTTPMMLVLPDPPRSSSISSTKYTSPVVSVR
jgi:hypothetical protein